jgi:hypothetical protein
VAAVAEVDGLEAVEAGDGWPVRAHLPKVFDKELEGSPEEVKDGKIDGAERGEGRLLASLETFVVCRCGFIEAGWDREPEVVGVALEGGGG